MKVLIMTEAELHRIAKIPTVGALSKALHVSFRTQKAVVDRAVCSGV